MVAEPKHFCQDTFTRQHAHTSARFMDKVPENTMVFPSIDMVASTSHQCREERLGCCACLCRTTAVLFWILCTFSRKRLVVFCIIIHYLKVTVSVSMTTFFLFLCFRAERSARVTMARTPSELIDCLEARLGEQLRRLKDEIRMNETERKSQQLETLSMSTEDLDGHEIARSPSRL